MNPEPPPLGLMLHVTSGGELLNVNASDKHGIGGEVYLAAGSRRVCLAGRVHALRTSRAEGFRARHVCAL